MYYSSGAGFMRDSCTAVSPNFGRKSSAPVHKSEKAESLVLYERGAGDIPGFASAQRYTPKFWLSMHAAPEQVVKVKVKKMTLNFTIVDKGKLINLFTILFFRKNIIKCRK